MERSFFARIDSNNANNPALNLTGAAATEITFIDETPSGGAGDLQLEQNGGAPDPDTVVSINGTAYSFVFEISGTLPTLARDGAGQVPDQFEGDPVYIVTVIDYPTAGDTTRFAFLPESGATQAEMDAFGNGAIDIQGATTNPPDSPVCFLEGTQIATPRGEIAVERLSAGDTVLTLDGAAQPIIWTGRSTLHWPGGEERHKPILISANALGDSLPRRDLIVSPQHRVLLQGAAVAAVFGSARILVPAISLVGLRGVRQMRGRRSAIYHHILLNAHSLLWAEGAITESFFPGPMALAALGPRQAKSVERAIRAQCSTSSSDYGPFAARAVVRRAAERFLAEAHLPLAG